MKRPEAHAIIDACPDAEWRLLFALSRFGGLRCPSEHLLLIWPDIDWDRERIHVTSPKTAHHGKGSRMIPLFPELRPFLNECFELAEPGAQYVITRYRRANSNLRTQLLRIIKRAGLEAWPKLFQNLRATRETELEETFPSHVVCAWIGNTEKVAAAHYLQVTEDHFEKAIAAPAGALQKRCSNQRIAPQRRSGRFYPQSHKPRLCRGLRSLARYYGPTAVPQLLARMGMTGFEPALLSERDPKSRASASSATSPCVPGDDPNGGHVARPVSYAVHQDRRAQLNEIHGSLADAECDGTGICAQEEATRGPIHRRGF